MKLIIEVELEDHELNNVDPEGLLVEKMYNLCDGWLEGTSIPKLTFIYNNDQDDTDWFFGTNGDDQLLN